MSEQKIYYTIIPTQLYNSPNTESAPVGELDTDTELYVLRIQFGIEKRFVKS